MLARVVLEHSCPSERIRDLGDLERVAYEVIGEGGHLPDGVRHGDQTQLRVVAKCEGVALGVDPLGEKDAPGSRLRTVGLVVDLRAAVSRYTLVADGRGLGSADHGLAVSVGSEVGAGQPGRSFSSSS